MSVVPYEQRTWITLMPAAAELAKQVANTEFVPKGLRGNPAAIAACILYGDELGIGPLQSLAKIAVIEGKPSLSAEAQRALILSAGHDMWVVESTNTKCTVAGRRSNSEHTSQITWTLDDAKRAGLAGRQNWRTYPRQMLMARATAELARLIFADAVGGLLATEELEDGEAEGDAEATTGSKRKRRLVAAPETSGRPQETNGVTAELPPLPDEFPSSSAESIAGANTGTDEPTAQAPSALEESGASPLPDAPDASPSDAPAPLSPTTRQLKKLNTLVGTLREGGHITTEQLWSAMASARNVAVDTLIDLYPDAYTPDGVLHWSPLRDSLIREEASNLIDRLERFEANVGAAA